ncbi:MAG: mannose-1-phosphate guanylyltransferase [Desulfomonilia bacterium]
MALHTVIMAGGKGERLWPISTPDNPKQMLAFEGTSSLLEKTFERSRRFSEPETIYVVTGDALREKVHRQLPEMPEENILSEPFGRNTAPCIGYAAVVISKKDPSGTMVVLPSDHIITSEDTFSDVITAGASALMTYPDLLITIGIVPESPETGYGYIAPGGAIETGGEIHLRHVVKFHEKPPKERAQEYVREGFLWNGGMFLWKVDTILKMFARYMPEMYEHLMLLKDSPSSSHDAVHQFYESVPSLSIDYGIMEKADRIAVIPVRFGWNDVGSWDALGRILPADDEGNAARGEHLFVDSSRNITYSSGKEIVLIDVHDLAVIEGDETILVCPRTSSQRVSEIVRKIHGK